MINTLFVAWQQPDSGEWIPVARLDCKDGKYYFVYTQGVRRAKEFKPFDGMNELDMVYESSVLFPLFSNRLINKSRPEFKNHLRWLGRDQSVDDPMAILALTGGIRGTDSIELFQPPDLTETKEYKLEFFARSLSYLPKETINLIDQLEVGSPLFLMKDCQNSFDPLALGLRSASPAVFVGYCPKYYTKDLGLLLDNENANLSVRIKCINPDAPLNMRLLCTATSKVPANFSQRESAPDFRPVGNELMPEKRIP